MTGASRGIGYAIAYDLASRGAKVVLTYSSDRSETTADELVQKIKLEANSTAIGVQCNLKSTDAPKKIVDATIKAFGHIDILVNNAGVFIHGLTQDVTLEHFDEIFHINVRAPLLMVQAVLPHLRRPGRIVNISSIGSRVPAPGFGTYSASKAALEGYTRSWATEFGNDGTTVNCVNPGAVQSEMLDQLDPKLVEPQVQATPIEKRVGKAEEIAEIAGFLAEERSSWITGQCISASGGLKMY